MHRIQIQLTPEQEQMLKDLARLRKASISALVREGVELLLEPERIDRAARVRRGMAYIGTLGPDPEGATDVSLNHDAYLADAYAGKIPKERNT